MMDKWDETCEHPVLVHSSRPIGSPLPTCTECGMAVLRWDDDEE